MSAPSRLCSVQDCGRPHKAHSYCKTHYRRVQRWGDPRVDIPVAPRSPTRFRVRESRARGEDAVSDDMPTVCIAHGSFIPCRKDGDHRYTDNPYWVKSVGDYQSSTVDGLTWEPAWER